MEAFKNFGQGVDLESDVDLHWEDLLDEFQSWSGCESHSRASVRMVPGTAVLLFLQKADLDNYAGREKF